MRRAVRLRHVRGAAPQPGGAGALGRHDGRVGLVAKERDPTTAALPFAPYDVATDNYVEIDDVSTTRKGFRTAICGGWDALGEP